jgi:hypothetical protein
MKSGSFEYDSFIHPIPTDSSYVFWFRISRELLGLDEDVVCGIVYIPPVVFNIDEIRVFRCSAIKIPI